MWKKCEQCKKDFFKYPSYFKTRSGRFCSRKCNLDFNSILWKTKANPIHSFDNSGKNNPMYGKKPYNYKADGSVRKDGYIRLTLNKKRVLKHRLIVEKHLGRKLTDSEIVHHKDGDNTNNDISNLDVITQSEHIKIHRKDLIRGRGKLSNSDDQKRN